MGQHRNARRGKQEILEKTRRQAASSGTFPTCENPGVTRPGIEAGSPWLTAHPQRPLFFFVTRPDSQLRSSPPRTTGRDLKYAPSHPHARGQRGLTLPDKHDTAAPTEKSFYNFTQSCNSTKVSLVDLFGCKTTRVVFVIDVKRCVYNTDPCPRASAKLRTLDNPKRVARVEMEQRRNARAGNTGDPRENPPPSDIVRYDSRMRKFRRELSSDRLGGRRVLLPLHHRDPRSLIRADLVKFETVDGLQEGEEESLSVSCTVKCLPGEVEWDGRLRYRSTLVRPSQQRAVGKCMRYRALLSKVSLSRSCGVLAACVFGKGRAYGEEKGLICSTLGMKTLATRIQDDARLRGGGAKSSADPLPRCQNQPDLGRSMANNRTSVAFPYSRDAYALHALGWRFSFLKHQSKPSGLVVQALIGERHPDMLLAGDNHFGGECHWSSWNERLFPPLCLSLLCDVPLPQNEKSGSAKCAIAPKRRTVNWRAVFTVVLLSTLDGATVAERLACSPPTKAIRVQSPAGLLLIFACGNRAGRCRWSAGFFLGDLAFPPPLHSGFAPFSSQSPSSVLQISVLRSIQISSLFSTLDAPGRRFCTSELALRDGHISPHGSQRYLPQCKVVSQPLATIRGSGELNSLPYFDVTEQVLRSPICHGHTVVGPTPHKTDPIDPINLAAQMSCVGIQWVVETEYPRENPPTSGIVRHDSRMSKSGSDSAENLTRFG
ncbi:hypothetical protein PR048_027195 [Dryococelus australis]|uniref:Uncharacterized protein n=1 Tax=Dryococelus australis TaxID=614101 RepID=A0ABQ9GET3_9NEOP|nr:hypothetical protein PR048_027195 [Dryococelus australis]